mgnify:CR=1 FL=1
MWSWIGNTIRKLKVRHHKTGTGVEPIIGKRRSGMGDQNIPGEEIWSHEMAAGGHNLSRLGKMAKIVSDANILFMAYPPSQIKSEDDVETIFLIQP